MNIINKNLAKLLMIILMLTTSLTYANNKIEKGRTDREVCDGLIQHLDKDKIASTLKEQNISIHNGSLKAQTACAVIIRSGENFRNKESVSILIYRQSTACQEFERSRVYIASKRIVRELMVQGEPWWQSFAWMRDGYYDYVINRQEFHFYTEAGDYLLFSFATPVPDKLSKETISEQNQRFADFINFVAQTLYNSNQ